MKRILLSFMLLVSTITMFAYDFEVDGIYYNITSEEELECKVTHNGEGSYSGIVSISPKVTYKSKEYTVKWIDYDAFCNSKELTYVVIPNSITSIGDHTFSGCSSLTSINIPNSVTYIGNYALYGCSSLTSVDIPNSVIAIGENTFEGCIYEA